MPASQFALSAARFADVCCPGGAAPGRRRFRGGSAAMDFGLTEEQRLIVETVRGPSSRRSSTRTRRRSSEPASCAWSWSARSRRKAIAAGLYAANMPEELGGAGLDTLTWLLYEKELGKANYALHWTCVARPSNILLGLHDRAARTLSHALHPRRELGLPGDDRTRRRLRPARHDGQRAAATAATGCSTAPSTSSATPTSPISPSASWPPARRKRRAAARS